MKEYDLRKKREGVQKYQFFDNIHPCFMFFLSHFHIVCLFTGVTVVITDIDDELPVFSKSEVSVPVPEDVGRLFSLIELTFQVKLKQILSITNRF